MFGIKNEMCKTYGSFTETQKNSGTLLSMFKNHLRCIVMILNTLNILKYITEVYYKGTYSGIWCEYNLSFICKDTRNNLATVMPMNSNCWNRVFNCGTIFKILLLLLSFT